MEETFLQTVYDITNREPLQTVQLADVASAMEIRFEEADRLASRLHAERLIYRFPTRRAGAGHELVITRAGIARLSVRNHDTRYNGGDGRVRVGSVLATTPAGTQVFRNCWIRVDPGARTAQVWRDRTAEGPEVTLPLDSVVIDWQVRSRGSRDRSFPDLA